MDVWIGDVEMEVAGWRLVRDCARGGVINSRVYDVTNISPQAMMSLIRYQAREQGGLN